MSKMQVLTTLRDQKRINFKAISEVVFDELLELHGDRCFADDPSLFTGIAKLGEKYVTVIGNQKGSDTSSNIKYNFGMVHPEGYRKAKRIVKQAEKFGRLIVTFIDTPGAYPGIGSEERGQGNAIAEMLEVLADVKVPVICVVISEGGSGGALAIGVGDYVIGFKNCYYSVISPEGFAEILYKGEKSVSDVIDEMPIFSDDLLRLGIIDAIYDEIDLSDLKNQIISAVDEFSCLSCDDLINKRYERYKKF